MSSYANPLTEYSPQMESFEFGEAEQEWAGESGGSVLSEVEELELAAELLEINNEEELEQFLGSLIKKVGGAVRKVVSSPVGKAIGGVLKGVAKKALPIAGGAVGGFFGGPLGAKIGSSLASMGGQALGLELEGLSREDAEFEASRQFVRFASEAVKNAVTAPKAADPAGVAKSAAMEAARVYAPGLLSSSQGFRGRKKSGRWVRSGPNTYTLD
jgi:hypothetical protein